MLAQAGAVLQTGNGIGTELNGIGARSEMAYVNGIGARSEMAYELINFGPGPN